MPEPLTAYVMIGIIGSGKSTWADKMISGKSIEGKERTTVVVSRDAIRQMYFLGHYEYSIEVEEKIKMISYEAVRHCIKSGMNVIIDDTNVSKCHRSIWVNTVLDENPDARIVFVHCPELKNNLQNRMLDPRGTNIGDWALAISMMKNRYEPPAFDEIPACKGKKTMITVESSEQERVEERENI